MNKFVLKVSIVASLIFINQAQAQYSCGSVYAVTNDSPNRVVTINPTTGTVTGNVYSIPFTSAALGVNGVTGEIVSVDITTNASPNMHVYNPGDGSVINYTGLPDPGIDAFNRLAFVPNSEVSYLFNLKNNVFVRLDFTPSTPNFTMLTATTPPPISPNDYIGGDLVMVNASFGYLLTSGFATGVKHLYSFTVSGNNLTFTELGTANISGSCSSLCADPNGSNNLYMNAGTNFYRFNPTTVSGSFFPTLVSSLSPALATVADFASVPYCILDSDLDGVVDDLDPDDDNDGILDTTEDLNADGDNDPSTNPTDSDNDGIPNYLDLDSDNDGIADVVEAGGSDPDGDGVIGTGTPTDNDDDGLADIVDPNQGGTPFPDLDTDNDGVSNYLDLDSDNDGITDIEEAGGVDVNNDGQVDYNSPGNPLTMLDGDNDGFADVTDTDNGGTNLPNPDTDNDGLNNTEDLDSDNDGITDVIEAGGSDPDNNGQIGSGTGVSIPDSDNDGLSNVVDLDNGGVPLNPPNSDNDAYPNYVDIDADNDGIVDNIESQSSTGHVLPSGNDSDNDGIDNAYDNQNGFGGAGTNPVNTDGTDNPDYTDLDSDNDGDVDLIEGWDTNNNGSANTTPSGSDSDNDGLDNAFDNTPLTNTSGNNGTNASNGGTTPNSFPNLDDNTTAELDWRELNSPPDNDNDGIADDQDPDDDNDGILDVDEDANLDGDNNPNTNPTDTDMDGIPNIFDLDSDNDGIADVVEAGGSDPDGNGLYGNGTPVDNNNDGIPDGGPLTPPNSDNDALSNFLDIDADNDGIVDIIEGQSTASYHAPVGQDNNQNGWDDSFEGVNVINIANTDNTDNPDYTDLDSDNDGELDAIEGWDSNNSGSANNVYSGTDSDNDGLDNAYDNTVLTTGTAVVTNPTNGNSTPNTFYDWDVPNSPERDWRETNLLADNDNDGIVNSVDPDDDNDGILDVDEDLNLDGDNNPNTNPTDTDMDGIPNIFDLDSDNDGIADVVEAGGSDPDGNGIIGNGTFVDADNDGLSDIVDPSFNGTPLANTNSDGDALPNSLDIDADNDGIVDNIEGQTTANYHGPSGVDANQNGWDDSYEGVNVINLANSDNTDAPDYLDLDSDNADEDDWEEGPGVPLSGGDSDGDGLYDVYDNVPMNATTANNGTNITNGNQTPNSFPNIDGDDPLERDWRDPHELPDNDQDSIDDSLDPDDDNDGILDVDEDANLDGDNNPHTNPTDSDNDGIPNIFDLDSDNDGIADVIEAGGTDPDGDGIIGSGVPADSDNDGLADVVDPSTGGQPLENPDSDNDGLADVNDIDADDDGIVDNIESQASDNYVAPSGNDVNQNGWDDVYEGNGAIVPVNTDGTDNPDYTDLDSDNDGDLDSVEGWDVDNDGVADTTPQNSDSDNDGLDDGYDNVILSSVSSGTGANATNSFTEPTDFPNNDEAATAELDWRENSNVELVIPQAFSPNNDGLNDVFEIKQLVNFPTNTMTILNRWGNKVYEVDEYHLNPWNGKNTFGVTVGGEDLPVGTYFYILEVEINEEVKVYKGYVYLSE